MSQVEIYDWLVTRVAAVLNINPDDVNVKIPFDRYGLESADVVGITAELEDWLGCTIDDPTLMYEYPTIDELSKHLATTHAV